MQFANFVVLMMMTGLIVQQRALQLVDGTGEGTIARFEAQRAAEAGLLIMILTMPWLFLAAWWMY
jgi:hypothetical protein